jgi:putative ribosome biogenesis GTPase RsgA
MPRPKLPREVVDTVVELLLCGWTPQDVVASWPEAVTDSVECVIHPTEGSPSLSVVQRLAREQGLARRPYRQLPEAVLVLALAHPDPHDRSIQEFLDGSELDH